MKKLSIFFTVMFFSVTASPLFAFAANEDAINDLPKATVPAELYNEHTNAENTGRKLWYRNVGEWVSSRTVREGLATEPTFKIVTDGKRFDTTVGKRIPVAVWGEKSLSEGWSAGIDGGMLASLERFNSFGRLTFGTNTFDGFFGANISYANGGNILMLRYAHLSAHLVDNSPYIYNAINYSQFWTEIIVGQVFPAPEDVSDFELYLQGMVGLNNTSVPRVSHPRAGLGLSIGKALSGPDTMAVLFSADGYRAGVAGQAMTYSGFLGLGFLQRPNSTHRPFRMGIRTLQGSDQRNQFYASKQNFTAFEIQTEF